jgi:hypothetical protein
MEIGKMDVMKEMSAAIESQTALKTAIDTANNNAADICRRFNDISFQLSAILKCKLFQGEDIEEAKVLNVTNLNDENYLSELNKIYRKYSYEDKLKSITSIVRQLFDYTEQLKRKRIKLSERIKLSKANTEESKTAHRLFKQVSDSMMAASARCDHLVKMFFDYRRAMLNYIMGNTEMLVDLFTENGEVSPVFKEYYNKRVKAESFHGDHETMNGKMKRRILK